MHNIVGGKPEWQEQHWAAEQLLACIIILTARNSSILVNSHIL